MTDETKENLGFFFFMAFACLVTFSATKESTDWSWMRQIAGHHAAEFYLDGHNYRQWRWVDCNPK